MNNWATFNTILSHSIKFSSIRLRLNRLTLIKKMRAMEIHLSDNERIELNTAISELLKLEL